MKTRHHQPLRALVLAAITLAAASAAKVAWAVHPQTWVHQTEKDYTDGQFDNVIVNNYGELRLGRQLTNLPTDPKLDFVNAFAQTADGFLYFATSPKGAVYKIAAGKSTLVFTAPEAQDQILSLGTDKSGNLLAALCGDGSKLLQLTPGPDGKLTPKTLFENPKIDYIWAIRTTPDGSIYLATGPDGQVWKIPADGSKPTIALDTREKNVYSLATDSKGNLYAGTDNHGLVFKLDAQTNKPFVLFDAGDVDISALTLDDSNNLYVATSSSDDQSHVAPSDTDDEDKTSKPDKPEPDTMEPADPDDPNNPPAPPTTRNENKTKESPAKKTDAKPQANFNSSPITPTPGLLAVTATPITPDLKAMIEKAKRIAANNRKPSPDQRNSQTTRNKSKSALAAQAKGGDEDTDQGNTLFKITPEGTVTTLLHEDDMLLSLLYQNGELLIGTGNEGKLYSYRPDQDAEALIARVTNENIMSLFAAKDGAIYFGTSDTGQVFILGNTPAPTGTYTSPVLDAKHIATWGSASLMASLPGAPAAKATLAVRTGNVKDVKAQEKFWSDWSPELPASGIDTTANITAPSARYLQYRLTLQADPKNQTPVVEQIRLTYQVANLAPKIENLVADTTGNSADTDDDLSKLPASSDASPDKIIHLTWDASDPNKDDLIFRLYYRELKDSGPEPWIPLEKNVKDSEYNWSTRAVPDGKYQIKVVASDSPDNPPDQAKATAQVTSAFLIVNTLPTIDDPKTTLEANKITLTGTAKATLCPVTDVRYQIDGGDPSGDWQPAAATDKMFDSPTEGFTLTTRPLAAGSHRVTIKVTDAQGNTGYRAVTVTVK